jgi:RNA polymerase sigma-70 factor (ECF subfamily)
LKRAVRPQKIRQKLGEPTTTAHRAFSDPPRVRDRLDERFREPLRRFFLRRTRSQSDADDLVQEVFFRVLRRGDQLQAESPAAYIFTVAANLLRERARHRQLDGPGEGSRAARLTYELIENSDAAFDPERILLGREALDALQDALGEMNERTRSILLLARLENIPQRVIAERMGISVSAVEKHLAKGIAFLARRLGRP